MTIPGMIVTEHPAPELAALRDCAQLCVNTGDFALEARALAVQFFNPMIHALMRGHAITISPYWRLHLDAARGRLLDRVALALGAVLVHNPVHSYAPAGSYKSRYAPAPAGLAKGPAPSPVGRAHAGGRNPAPCLPALALQPGVPALGQLAGALAAAQLRPAYDGPGVGAWRTDGRGVLIVGDRPNSSQHALVKQRVPFFSMHGGGCSLWLAQLMEDAGIPEDRLYWINAYTWDGHETPSEFVDALNPLHIVALGENAAQWCRRARLSYEPFAHPGYAKRWTGGEEYPLIKYLKGVTK